MKTKDRAGNSKIDGEVRSGVHFGEQTVDSLLEAIETFERQRFNATAIRTHAESFDREVYRSKMMECIDVQWNAWTAAEINRTKWG